MMFLSTKIPPPIVTIVFAILIFYFSDYFFYIELPYKEFISIFFVLLGFYITFSSARNFKKKRYDYKSSSTQRGNQIGH